MPPRVSRSSVKSAASKTARNKNRKRNLDAYAIASHSTSADRIAAHRLGESIDDGPRQKRRRDEDEDEESEDDSAPAKKLPRRRTGEDDGVEEGEDSEGNEWTLGGLAEGDEDSELDSDEAFGESDEEKFEGFTFRGSSNKKPVKRREQASKDDGIDLDEGGGAGEESEEEGWDQAVDLATMLDDDPDEALDGNDQDDDDEDDEDESESDPSSEDEDDDANNEERIARLRDRLEALDESNQSSTKQPPAQPTTLSIDDLLADLDPTIKQQFTSTLKPKKKSQAPKTLTAPLPPRQQARLDRQVANQKAKEQLDRWRDTVIHNRRAEFFTFPLVDPNRGDPIGKEKFVTEGVEPQTELERNVKRIMEESGIVSAAKGDGEGEDEEDTLMKAEGLATNKLPVEEVLRRRAELRRQRDLLFREEVKAKRIAKIKSKSYRRVHRREREKLAERERALIGDGDMGEDEKERAERKRAEERMGTKHRDSKWAKSLKASKRTVWDEGAREGVVEEARRREELRRRIAGEDVGSDASSDVSDDDGDDEEEATLERLDQLKDPAKGVGEKGVGAMKFMRAAEERQRMRNEEDVERLRREMAVEDGDERDSENDGIEDQGLGRALFGPRATKTMPDVVKPKKPEMEEGDVSADEEEQIIVTEKVEEEKQPKSILKKPKTNSASGPLARGPQVRDRRVPDADGTADEGPAMPSVFLTAPEAKKSKRDRQRGREADGEVLVQNLNVASLGKKAETEAGKRVAKGVKDANIETTKAGNTDGWQTVPYTSQQQEADDADETEEPPNAILSTAEQTSSYHRRAFAGDDVALAFAAEKEALAASEDEKEESTHLPGWGSWTGAGLSKSIRRANKKAAHNPLYKHKLPGGVKPEDRKDGKKGMEKVIVSEKKDRKGKGYLAPMLPHGFERKEEYERSLRVPVGPEWTTKEVFQRGTRPRVVVAPGRVVEAMERPLV